jgi:hypothetical protein
MKRKDAGMAASQDGSASKSGLTSTGTSMLVCMTFRNHQTPFPLFKASAFSYRLYLICSISVFLLTTALKYIQVALLMATSLAGVAEQFLWTGGTILMMNVMM